MVTGEARYARKSLDDEFDSVMTSTNGGMLFGLRRIGKSTEANACVERLRRQHPQTVIYQDAQGCASETKLLLDMLKQLARSSLVTRLTQLVADDNAISATVRDALKKFAGRDSDIQAYREPLMDAMERSIESSDQIVLVIDEFPWLCRNIVECDAKDGARRVDVLLAALRKWRAKGLRMLVLGSIGMAGLARRHRLELSHLNDLVRLEVPPLQRDEAEEFVECLAKGAHLEDWTREHTQRLIEESAAWYTSILQYGFQRLTLGGRAAPIARVSEIFADKIRPNLDSAFLEQFDRRVAFYRQLEAPLPDLVSRLLEAIVSTGAPVEYQDLCKTTEGADDSDLGDALTILREDGFLTMRAPREQGQIWRPASTLVTEWWRQRRGGRRK